MERSQIGGQKSPFWTSGGEAEIQEKSIYFWVDDGHPAPATSFCWWVILLLSLLE